MAPGPWKGGISHPQPWKVAPEMRAVVARACAILEATSFVEDLDRDVCADGDEVLRSE